MQSVSLSNLAAGAETEFSFPPYTFKHDGTFDTVVIVGERKRQPARNADRDSIRGNAGTAVHRDAGDLAKTGAVTPVRQHPSR